MSSNNHFYGFLDLPKEIRDHVYELVLRDEPYTRDRRPQSFEDGWLPLPLAKFDPGNCRRAFFRPPDWAYVGLVLGNRQISHKTRCVIFRLRSQQSNVRRQRIIDVFSVNGITHLTWLGPAWIPCQGPVLEVDVRGRLELDPNEFLRSTSSVDLDGAPLRVFPLSGLFLFSVLVAYFVLGPSFDPAVAPARPMSVVKLVINLMSTEWNGEYSLGFACPNANLAMTPPRHNPLQQWPVMLPVAAKMFTDIPCQDKERHEYVKAVLKIVWGSLSALLMERRNLMLFLMARVGTLRLCMGGFSWERKLQELLSET